MARITVAEAGPYACAALDVLGYSEIGARMLADPRSDDGYKILVGSTPGNLILLRDYSRHPHIINSEFNSSATGRYQFIFSTWEGLRLRLKLPDFSPVSQDRACIQLLRDCGALNQFRIGNIAGAFAAAAPTWASLPGAGATLPDGRPQHENRADDLTRYYTAALGEYMRDPGRFGTATVSGSIA